MLTTVSNTQQLEAALKAAHGGDTIRLTHGTYSVSARGLHFDSSVTITSADTASPAIIKGITLTDSSGLIFAKLTFYSDPAGPTIPFRVEGSQNIAFDHLSVHGSLDENPKDDNNGFLIRGSSHISVTNSEFQQLGYGIGQLSDDHLTLSGNIFHDIRMDGIRGGGSSWVTISGNAFHDFHPNPKDHPDAIQFWTTNTSVSAHDIAISDNVVERGSGEPIQGIFIRDEVGHLPYKHLTITGNLVVGGLYHGISVGHAMDVTVSDNIVQAFSGPTSWIRLDHVNTADVSGNAATTLTILSNDTHITQSGNTILQAATDGGAAALQMWTAAHKAGASFASGPPAIVDVASSTVSALTGNAFANHLTGGAADEVISGLGGDDLLIGMPGADTLIGGAGNDTLRGGAGADNFVFGKGDGHDVIVDFGHGGHDTIDASALFATGAQSTLTNVSAGVEIAFTSGESILVRNVATSDLHATSTGWIF